MKVCTSYNQASFPETAKLIRSLEREKSKGLQDVKFFIGNTVEANIEELSVEVNAMFCAEAVPDTLDEDLI